MKVGTNILSVLVALACLAVSPMSSAQHTALEGLTAGALDPENLAKPRPAAPFDLTGTWNMVIEPSTGMHQFFPQPELTPAAEAQVALRLEWADKGYEYRDDPGACWPLGLPRMMTRFHPIQIIQLPTMIQLVTMFNNDIRWIYTDGRSHPSEEDLIYNYNGHSIGHWEGDTLVVDTVGMTDDHHWIQEGIPASTQLHVVERYRIVDDELQIEFTMTDPENWVGEWVNTKTFRRLERTDIEEHVCILEQMELLPSFKYNIRE